MWLWDLVLGMLFFAVSEHTLYGVQVGICGIGQKPAALGICESELRTRGPSLSIFPKHLDDCILDHRL